MDQFDEREQPRAAPDCPIPSASASAERQIGRVVGGGGLLLACCGEEVRADTEKFGDGLHSSEYVEQQRTLLRIVHAFVDVGQREGDAFETDERLQHELRGENLFTKLVRSMGITVEARVVERWHHAGPFHIVDQLAYDWVLDVEALHQHSVQAGRPPRDGRRMDHATMSHDAPSLAQRLQPVAAVLQVIQRTEEQHGIDRIVGEVERASIADRAVDPIVVAIPDLVDVMGYEITMDDLVTRVDEPIGIAPGTAPDIRDHRARRRKRSPDDLNRPAELNAAHPERKSVAFLITCVVRLKLPIGHAPSCRAEPTERLPFPSDRPEISARDRQICANRPASVGAGSGFFNRPACSWAGQLQPATRQAEG